MFAIMRNAHEVIRGMSRDCVAKLEEGDLEGFKQAFASLTKV